MHSEHEHQSYITDILKSIIIWQLRSDSLYMIDYMFCFKCKLTVYEGLERDSPTPLVPNNSVTGNYMEWC